MQSAYRSSELDFLVTEYALGQTNKKHNSADNILINWADES